MPLGFGPEGWGKLEILSCRFGDESTEVLFLVKGDKDKKWIERRLMVNRTLCVLTCSLAGRTAI